MERGGGTEAGGALELAAVGVCLVDVAGLHGEHLLACLPTGDSLDGLDIVEQAHWAAVADVIDLCGSLTAGDDVDDAHEALDDVVDIGEVSQHIPVIEDFYGAVMQDGVDEEEGRHIGAPPRTVDGEEAQSGGGQ